MHELHTQDNHALSSEYDENRITVLNIDPYWLFSYWELSSNIKNRFLESISNEIWEKSLPVLKISNISKNTSFFIHINEYASSWYIKVNDPNSLYVVEIGRKLPGSFFISFASSNYIATPADNISSNTTTFFIDYNSLNNVNFNLISSKVYETYRQNSYTDFTSGISSPGVSSLGI
ncbi:MAG TPA: DUF4912 domain-containing protein [Clostridiaceae bacterium]|nr:DUF4912 domain-containing protein [Clostridiaceae bacterium]